MRGPKPEPLTLSDAEQTELERLVRRHGTPQQQALRGRMILAAAEGKNNSHIAHELGVCVDTVRTWRMRWIGLQAVGPCRGFGRQRRERHSGLDGQPRCLSQ